MRQLPAIALLAVAASSIAAAPAGAAPPKSWTTTLSANCPPADFGPSTCQSNASSMVSVGKLGPHGEAVTNGRVEIAVTVPGPQCANGSVSLHAVYKGGAGLSDRYEMTESIDFTQPGTTKVVSDAWGAGPWKMMLTGHGGIHQDPSICPGNDGTVRYSIRVTVRSLPVPGERVFNASGPRGADPESGLTVGDTIRYSGRSWKKGPVEILFAGRRIAKAKGPSFAGSFRLPPWKNGACRSQLVARQGGRESVMVAGERLARVAYGRDARIGKRKLRKGDYLCAGERLGQLHVRGALVARTTLPNGGVAPDGTPAGLVSHYNVARLVFPGQLVATRSVFVPGGVFAKRIRIDGKTLDALSGDEVSYEIPTDAPGPSVQDPGSEWPPGATAAGSFQADGNLKIRGVDCDAAFFYVNGRLDLAGPVSGFCTFSAGGPAVLSGRTNMLNTVEALEAASRYYSISAALVDVR